jgi:transcriptional regulator GlxA family with amidase domain
VLTRVAVPVIQQAAPFELGVLCEVFGTDRSATGLPRYEFSVVAAEPGPIQTHSGFALLLPEDLTPLEGADLIALPAAGSVGRDYPPALLAALRRAVDRGARVLSLCSGAFMLGAAGLLDGRRCTTHWMYAEPPVPASHADTLEELLEWLAAHLDEVHTVEGLARRAHMSPRTFARRFRAETGTTPFAWITGQRVLLAQRLLEDTDETLDAIAARTGFGTASVLRHHFLRWRSTTPQAYRRTFRSRAA